MSGKTSTWLLILSVLIALCLSMSCCTTGFASLAGGGTYQIGAQTGQMPPAAGIPFICLGGLVWVLPPGLWYWSRKKG